MIKKFKDYQEENLSIKNQLKAKELRFIELFLSGEYRIENAIILAGYGNYSQKQRYRIATKIVQKFEAQASDHRKIFMSVGLGQVRIAKKLDAMMDAASERTHLRATELAAKCLRMASDPPMVTTGVQIIIRGQDDDEPDHEPDEGTGCRRPSIRFEQEIGSKRKVLERLLVFS